MRIVVVEDETAATINLLSIIREVCPGSDVLATLESVADSIKWFTENPHPDLVFMDIHLADGDAFRIFEKVDITAPVVFTTAYDMYALDAFRVNSIDYLLKPIKPADMRRAVEKHERLTGKGAAEYEARVSTFASAQNTVKGSFLIHYKDKLIPVRSEEIAFFYTRDEKVTLHTLDGREYGFERPLDATMAELPETGFYRANRQFIISREAIHDVSVWFGSRLSVNLKTPVPERIIISKARVPDFKRWLTATSSPANS